ncbi:hypothetical protein OAC89_06695 [Deltaproteobacteria bacterium]|nr:hypothetical protein [Deltaproteobacteria bacterium]
MKRLFFKISLFSFLLVFLNLLLLNSFAAQAPMGPSQGGISLIQELAAFSLPEGPITDNDIPQIKTVIQQVLDKISENKKSTGKNKADVQPMISGIVVFKDWLSQQACVNEVSIPYVQDSGESIDNIFLSYPGQVFVNLIFNTGAESTERYRLLVFVSAADALKFGSIIQDNTPPSS